MNNNYSQYNDYLEELKPIIIEFSKKFNLDYDFNALKADGYFLINNYFVKNNIVLKDHIGELKNGEFLENYWDTKFKKQIFNIWLQKFDLWKMGNTNIFPYLEDLNMIGVSPLNIFSREINEKIKKEIKDINTEKYDYFKMILLFNNIYLEDTIFLCYDNVDPGLKPALQRIHYNLNEKNKINYDKFVLEETLSKKQVTYKINKI
jgi:hypothetical protein